MADNNDLLVQIATLFADNNTGEISPADLSTSLSAMVTASLNLDETTRQEMLSVLSTNSPIAFDPEMPAPTYEEGLLFYDSDKRCFSYYNNKSAVSVNIGREVLIQVHNTTASTILNGSAVRPTGAISGLVSIAPSDASALVTAGCYAVTTMDIPAGTTGYCAYIGEVDSVDTSGFTAGEVLFVSATTPGELTNVEPAISSPVGIVLTSQVDGSIFIGQKEVNNPTAVGQNLSTATTDQDLSTTPAPLEGFLETAGLEIGVTISTPVGVGGDRRCIISPATSQHSGFYSFTATITGSNSSNRVLVAELYINGSATGIVSYLDTTQGTIDEGNLIFARTFIEDQISETDELELYFYTKDGNTTFTNSVVMFNVRREGTI